MNRPVIFLGPSLGLDAARAICPGEYRPPVQMGDVYRAVEDGARTIAIVDGLFERIPAVWHKEILFALDRGVAVYGGGSMGALRAAELHAFGMIGVGAIFRDFASGALNDDDEVAVAHGTAESAYLATSVAMVNLRSGLLRAVEAGCLDSEEAQTLLDTSKARFYPERSWEGLLGDARSLGLAPARIGALERFLEEERPDQKRDDAVEVLKTVAAALGVPRAEPAKRFGFEHTVYWETVETYCSGRAREEGLARFERVRNHVRLFEADRDRLLERALLFFLAEQEARRLKLPTADERVALTRFRASRGLATAAALAGWMSANQVDRATCLALARAEMQLNQVMQRHIAIVDRHLAPVLQMEGRLADLSREVGAKWQFVAGQEIGQVSEQDVDPFVQIIDWYQERFGPLTESVERHAAERGMGSVHQWREEIFVEYLNRAAAC